MRRDVNDMYEVYGDEDLVPPLDDTEPSRKRRRTIVDVFQSISLSEHEKDRQSVSPVVTDVERIEIPSNDIVAAPQDDFMIDAEDDDDESVDSKPLSLKEVAEREIMRALVYGPSSSSSTAQGLQRQDPVDQKLQDLIRGSIQKAIRQDSQCDMDIETSYTRPSSMESEPVGNRPRSNSLPNEFTAEQMEMDFTPLWWRVATCS